jgi:hypothetical protein
MAKPKAKPSPKEIITFTVYSNGVHYPVSLQLVDEHGKHSLRAVWINPDKTGNDIIANGSDIERLKRAMEKRLEDHTKHEWQPRLHVEVDGEFPYDLDLFVKGPDATKLRERKGKMEIVVTECEVAVNSCEDRVHRMGDTTGVVHQGWPTEGARETDSWTEKDMSALIPDTVENRRALAAIFDGLRILRDRLSHLLAPDRVLGSLSSIGVTKLLQFTQEGSSNATGKPVAK